MKDLSLERAQPPRCATPYWPIHVSRCACCSAIMRAAAGSRIRFAEWQEVAEVAGCVAKAVVCGSAYCVAQAKVIAQVAAFSESMNRAVFSVLTTITKVPH